jgi:hypothetical protein
VKLLALVALAGCNWVLDLAPTTEITTPPPPGVIVPPDGPTNCPSPPDFSTWSFAPRTIPGFTQPIDSPAFITEDRVIFASQGQLFESALDGGATAITSLDLPDSSLLGQPSPAPGGDVFWFVRNGGSQAGTFYAVRDDAGWSAHRADFGFSTVNIELGAAAFYGGRIRLPVRRADEQPYMVEIDSSDGVSWTVLQAIDEPNGDAAAFSADGCLMLYIFQMPSGSGFSIAVAPREANGAFGAGTLISQVTEAATAAIDPSYRRVWIVDKSNALIEGLAP